MSTGGSADVQKGQPKRHEEKASPSGQKMGTQQGMVQEKQGEGASLIKPTEDAQGEKEINKTWQDGNPEERKQKREMIRTALQEERKRKSQESQREGRDAKKQNASESTNGAVQAEEPGMESKEELKGTGEDVGNDGWISEEMPEGTKKTDDGVIPQEKEGSTDGEAPVAKGCTAEIEGGFTQEADGAAPSATQLEGADLLTQEEECRRDIEGQVRVDSILDGVIGRHHGK